MSVHAGDVVEKPSVQPICTLAEALPASKQTKADESRDRPSSADRLSWRGRYRSRVSFLVVLTFLVLTIVFIMAHGKIADPDIWWHLHNADYLVHHHSLPRSDCIPSPFPAIHG